MNDPEQTIRTDAGGRRAAAIRDGRADAGDATTRVIAYRRAPAPWTAHPDRGFSYVEAANGDPVAGDLNESEVHLIAAAPELLALCREAAALIAGIPNAYESDRLMVARLNAAVAKAEQTGCPRCGGVGTMRLLGTHEIVRCTECARA
jgi:hypothetical protein